LKQAIWRDRQMGVLAKTLKKLAARSAVASVSPSAFNDPLALETEWTPLKSGGANFKTAGLHRVSVSRWEFRSSLGLKLFSAVFVVLGLAVCIVAVNKHWPASGSGWDRELFLIGGVGLLFTLAGSWMAYAGSVPAVFDKNHGYFVKSRKKPEHLVNPTTLKSYSELKRVHALQLLAEHCKGDKSSYFSYELNLVLDDGSRINVIDHGNLQAVRQDAAALAEFLGKPVWDSI
jgi:hypothetical protein